MNRRQLFFVISIALIVLLAYVLISHPSTNTGNYPNSQNPGSQNSQYKTIFNENISVKNGETGNYAVNVGSVSTIKSMSLTAYSNHTPAALMLVQNGKVFNQISLTNVANAKSSYSTFADPPTVNLYGGIWYLVIQNITSSGTIHVLVSVEYFST